MPCTRFRELWGEAPDECFSAGTVVEENKRKLTIQPSAKEISNGVCKILVDGCLIEGGETKKCDFAFFLEGSEQIILVECKGQAISKAVEQIITTFKIVREKFLSNPKKGKRLQLDAQNTIGIVVASKVDIPSNKLKMVKDKYRKQVGGKLIIKTGHLLYKI